MIRNQASKLTVFAFNITTNAPVTGDAANITCKVSKDDAALASVTDTNPTEISSTDAPGMYRFDLLAGETDADKLEYFPKSSTSNVQVLALPSDVIYTRPANFSLISIDSNGRLDVIKVAGTTQTARDLGASVLISAGTGSGQLDVTSGRIKADTVYFGGAAGTFASGRPEVNATHFGGTAGTFTAGAGILDVNAQYLQGDTPVTAVATGVYESDPAVYNTASTFGALFNSVLADTNELQTDWVNGGRLDLIVDAILADTNELQTDWADGGRLDLLLDGASSAGDPWTTTLPGAYTGSQAGKILSDILADTGTDGVVIASGQTMEMSATELRAALGMAAADLDSQLDAIVADTNELQTDWANGGRLDLILDARASQSSVDTIDGIVDSILLDTAEIGAAGAGLTALPWNAAWDAEAQSEANDALVALGLDHLVSAAVVGADVTDNSIVAKLASKSATADWDDFVNTTDSLQAIRDRGDAAWTGDGGGGGGQPRINQPPAPAYTVAIDRITHRGSRKIWLTPGTVGDIAVFVDMAPLFGANNYVATVGTPTVSGGSVTATELGPRDTYAVVELSGTATASEERTVDVAVTMETGEQISIEFDFEVFAE